MEAYRMCVSRKPVARVEYVRVKDGKPASVIYEVMSDGQEVFSESEFDELRWYAFEPSDFELQAARRLRAQGKGQSGQGAGVDLNA